MRWQHWLGSLALAGVAAVAVVSGGCTKDAATTAKAKKTGGDEHADDKEAKVDLKKGDHSGWWCQEHGIPEEDCSLCLPQAEVKKRFQDVGDWCNIHDRAKSQCFKCDPGLYKKYEAMYVAKYNKKPEPPPKEEFEK
ncbi:MAG: hypothetical protein L0Y71_22635 [Gemmataceae bacterium]|nr:hypothetical protein [Gemmataceae bacterium]